MTDSRGIITYSSVVRVNKNIKTLQVNGPFPNPVKDKLQFNISSASKANAIAEIITMTGVKVSGQPYTLLPGETGFSMDVSRLSPGFYILRITPGNGDLPVQVKFAKQ